MKVAIIGGTGNLGRAIAGRLSKSGHTIIIGSRFIERAEAAAAEIGLLVQCATNTQAAADCELAIIAVPFSAQESTITDIKPHVRGKIVIDATVPLAPPKVTRVQLPKEGSAAERASHLLGEGVMVASAFHNIAAHHLANNQNIDCDILVFSDNKEVRARVIEFVETLGLRGIHGGCLANSAAAEAMTSVLIFINKTYKVDGAGLRITGPLGA